MLLISTGLVGKVTYSVCLWASQIKCTQQEAPEAFDPPFAVSIGAVKNVDGDASLLTQFQSSIVFHVVQTASSS